MVYERILQKKHRKWEKQAEQHGIGVSCTEKHGKWETHTVEHGI